MNISLPEGLIAFVREETQSGGYANDSDVVRDGLRLMRDCRQKRALLRALSPGDADVSVGKS